MGKGDCIGMAEAPLINSSQPTWDIAMQHLTPKQAYEFLKSNAGAVFIDVRSGIERLFVGHPENSMLIPWVDEQDWEINSNFVAHVKDPPAQTVR
jgi:rhodanese-related sulfurtransferase